MKGILIICLVVFTGNVVMADQPNSTQPCAYCRQPQYKIITNSSRNWFAAFAYCESLGLELATITSQEEETALETELNRTIYRPTIGYGFWLGATLYDLQTYTWLTSGKELTYRNFPEGQPDQPDVEQCVEIFYYNEKEWYWNDHVCDNEKQFVCQTKSDCCYTKNI